MSLDPDRYRLPEAVHQAIFQKRIAPHLFADAKPAPERPVAVIFGGQPGAGKSASVDFALRQLAERGGAAQIIGDDLRSYHPQYARLLARDDKTAAFYTDRDTGRWVEMAIDRAKANRLNIVIEGTMRDPSTVAKTMLNLRGAGYLIDARILAVNERLSWQGVLQRYENQKADRGYGRMTAPHSHRDAYNGIPATLDRIESERLADRVSLYRRGAVELYANELQRGEWAKPPGARAALEAERSRPLTLHERHEYAVAFDKLLDLMARPERNSTAAEIDAMQQLREKAHMSLKAAMLRELPEPEALRRHPDLAPTYQILQHARAKAELDGLPPNAQTAVVDKLRNELADRLEVGVRMQIKAPERRPDSLEVAKPEHRPRQPNQDLER